MKEKRRRHIHQIILFRRNVVYYYFFIGKIPSTLSPVHRVKDSRVINLLCVGRMADMCQIYYSLALLSCLTQYVYRLHMWWEREQITHTSYKDADGRNEKYRNIERQGTFAGAFHHIYYCIEPGKRAVNIFFLLFFIKIKR